MCKCRYHWKYAISILVLHAFTCFIKYRGVNLSIVVYIILNDKMADTFLDLMHWLFSECKAKCCGSECDPTSSPPAGLYVGTSVGASVVLIIVIFVIVFIVRGRQGETADDTYLHATHDNAVSLSGENVDYSKTTDYYITEFSATSEESLSTNAS